MPSKHFADGTIVPGTTWTPPVSRQTYAIFRQERFVGWCDGDSAADAIEMWIDTPLSNGVLPRNMPGPWMAVEKTEAMERRLIK